MPQLSMRAIHINEQTWTYHRKSDRDFDIYFLQPTVVEIGNISSKICSNINNQYKANKYIQSDGNFCINFFFYLRIVLSSLLTVI